MHVSMKASFADGLAYTIFGGSLRRNRFIAPVTIMQSSIEFPTHKILQNFIDNLLVLIKYSK